MCAILKKLGNKLQRFYEASRIINEILESKKGNDMRVLKHLISYAETQFGMQIKRIGYREREDGKRISNYC
jgi:hypothetical protein